MGKVLDEMGILLHNMILSGKITGNLGQKTLNKALHYE